MLTLCKIKIIKPLALKAIYIHKNCCGMLARYFQQNISLIEKLHFLFAKKFVFFRNKCNKVSMYTITWCYTIAEKLILLRRYFYQTL